MDGRWSDWYTISAPMSIPSGELKTEDKFRVGIVSLEKLLLFSCTDTK